MDGITPHYMQDVYRDVYGIEGGSFRSWIQNTFFQGRQGGEKSVNDLLAAHGNAIIQDIVVGRIPVQSAVTRVGNALSSGELAKVQKDLNYDGLFHLFLLIKLSDGYYFQFDKHEYTHVTPNPKIPDVPGKSLIQVPNVLSKQLKLNTFVANGMNILGKENFYHYSAFEHNCQEWAQAMLKGSGLLTPELNTFIMQDVKTIAKRLPSYFSGLANTLTDIASVIGLVRGKGKRYRKRRSKSHRKR